jgi:hypothetical protein
MSKHYGVICRECKTPIILDDLNEDTGTEMTFYTVQSEPIACAECGFSGLYGPKDGHPFQMEDKQTVLPERLK